MHPCHKKLTQTFQLKLLITSINMKCIFLKLATFAMLATASGVYASSDGDGDAPSSTTHQTLRGSFLNEDEGADLGWGKRNRPDLSTCTTDCQCWQGKAFLWHCSQSQSSHFLLLMLMISVRSSSYNSNKLLLILLNSLSCPFLISHNRTLRHAYVHTQLPMFWR